MFTSSSIAGLRHEMRGETAWIRTVLIGGMLIVLGAWLVLIPVTSSESYQTLAVQALTPRTRVVAFGTSHVHVMIDPAQIDVPMMNLSGDAHNYVAIESVLHGHLDQLEGLDAVLIEFDIILFLYDTFEVYEGDYSRFLDLEPDLSHLHTSLVRQVKLRWQRFFTASPFFGPFVSYEKLSPKRLVELLLEERPATIAGHNPREEVMTPDREGPNRLEVHSREGDVSHIDENMEALIRSMDVLRQSGITIILIRHPHHRTYWENRPRAWDQRLERIQSELRHRYDDDGFVYWDLERLPFSDDEFFDGDHLNTRGVERYCDQLSERLELLLADQQAAERR